VRKRACKPAICQGRVEENASGTFRVLADYGPERWKTAACIELRSCLANRAMQNSQTACPDIGTDTGAARGARQTDAQRKQEVYHALT